MRIYLATANQHKIKEMQALLAPLGAEVSSHPEYALMNVEETGDTFEANAIIKSLALSQLTDDYVIADDSGLEVYALDNDPGVYSARYAGEKATDEMNNQLLLQNLANIDDTSSRYVCVLALSKGGKVVGTFEGTCEGRIIKTPRGSNGFGYDPIFEIANGLTMAEMSSEAKNLISHRYLAMEKLYKFLKRDIF